MDTHHKWLPLKEKDTHGIKSKSMMNTGIQLTDCHGHNTQKGITVFIRVTPCMLLSIKTHQSDRIRRWGIVGVWLVLCTVYSDAHFYALRSSYSPSLDMGPVMNIEESPVVR